MSPPEKKRIVILNLMEFDKGLSKIRWEGTCTDFGTQYIVLSAFPLISSWEVSRYDLSPKEKKLVHLTDKIFKACSVFMNIGHLIIENDQMYR